MTSYMVKPSERPAMASRYASAVKSALASCKSLVSKPSVNQPGISAACSDLLFSCLATAPDPSSLSPVAYRTSPPASEQRIRTTITATSFLSLYCHLFWPLAISRHKAAHRPDRRPLHQAESHSLGKRTLAGRRGGCLSFLARRPLGRPSELVHDPSTGSVPRILPYRSRYIGQKRPPRSLLSANIPPSAGHWGGFRHAYWRRLLRLSPLAFLS